MAKKKKDDGGDFLSNWLGAKRPKDLSKLSRRTIKSDRWDEEDWNKILREMRDLDASRSKLCEVMTETGNGMAGDAFHSFKKVQPEDADPAEIRPDYLVNAFVRDEMRALPQHEELRNLGTVGDDVNSAFAFITMEPDIETAFDKVKKEQELAEKLMKQMLEQQQNEAEQKTADQLLEEMENEIAEIEAEPDDEEEEGEGEGEGDGDGPDGHPGVGKGKSGGKPGGKKARLAAAKDKQKDFQNNKSLLEAQYKKLKETMAKTEQELRDGLKDKAPQVRAALSRGMDKAVDEAEALKSMDTSWGIDPGTLQRLPAAERIALAKKIKDRPKLKRLAQLIGPMNRLRQTEQRRKVDKSRSEVVNIEQGRDLSRLIPQELVKVRHPVLRRDFRRRFLEGTLLQYKMAGKEKVGLGGIICAIDESGSMGGDREIWAKAVAISLLNAAKEQKRSFKGIHFGSSSELLAQDFFTPADYTPEAIIDFAEFFFGGGTDFMRPLSAALDHLREEHKKSGMIKGDIVLITDGECGVHPEWLEEFKAEQVRLNFQVFGVLIGGGYSDEPLNTICDGRVCLVHNLVSGDEIRSIFSGMNQP